MSMNSRVFAWRCRRAVDVLELSARRHLESDLTAYSTAREQTDLLALLAGCDDEQAADVREILGHQQIRDSRRWRTVAGLPARGIA